VERFEFRMHRDHSVRRRMHHRRQRSTHLSLGSVR
jgi:hypothetical protein